ncbi:MAG: hypothetical protein FWJ70_00425 [Micromonosporaceae bacterium]
MSFNAELQILAYTLALARSRHRPGPRPARQVVMAARKRAGEHLQR